MLRFTSLILHFIRIIILLTQPKGTKALIAENLMLRKQLIQLSRKHKRSPKLSFLDRLFYAIGVYFINPNRLNKSAIIIKSTTIIKFHKALIKQKYHLLFSPKSARKPGSKGPSNELIQLITEMKKRNPQYGYLRIAMQIKNIFGININKDTVRRILQKHLKNDPGNNNGPSWLTFIGHMKDSLWSVDLFRCESILLKSHWVMVLMDQFSRKIIGFSVHLGELDGNAICCMFNKIISKQPLPKYLSSDNDPLFQYHRWKANLRVLDITEIKTIPYIPLSHPYIERLIKSVRNELLDQTLFWNSIDLQKKLNEYQIYFNQYRSHKSLNGATPEQKMKASTENTISIKKYWWQNHCKGLFQLPIAA